MNQLKALGYAKINRCTIGKVVGEVSNQVAQNTNPSVYPSAIVVRKGKYLPGDGFGGSSWEPTRRQKYQRGDEA